MSKLAEENYISLQEATRYCNYSQEYLSLRVRQGKIKAVKLGRNWVTKKEWIIEYVEGALTYKNGNGKKNDITEEKKPVFEISKIEKESNTDIPENLPVGQFSEAVQNLFDPPENKDISVRFVASFFFVCLVLFSSFYFFRNSLGDSFYEASSFVKM